MLARLLCRVTGSAGAALQTLRRRLLVATKPAAPTLVAGALADLARSKPEADSPITTLADLRGKTFAYVDPASTSGHLVPNYVILTKAGLKSNVDYRANYAGTHLGAYQAVANKRVDAGAIARDAFASGVQQGSIDQTKVRIIDTSFPIPDRPIAYRGNLPQGAKDAMLELFLSIDDQPREGNVWRAAAFALGGGIARLRKADDSAYDELRKIPAAIGIDIKTLR